MYQLTPRERRMAGILKRTGHIDPANILLVEVDLLTGLCTHVRDGKWLKCDCLGTQLSDRTEKLQARGLAKVSYGRLDLSFL